MPTFLGAEIVYPLVPGIVTDEQVANAGGVEQVTVGGTRSRRTIEFGLMPEGALSPTGLNARLQAHVNRYKHGTPFDFEWFQLPGVEVPGVVVTVVGNTSAGAREIQLNTNTVDIGTVFQFTGSKVLYEISAKPRNMIYEIDPILIGNVSGATVLDFTPTSKAKHRAGSGISYRYDEQGFAIPIVSLIESR